MVKNMKIQLLSLLLLASFGEARAQEMPASLDRYLRETVKLTPAELADAKAGRPVAKLLATDNSRDVAVFGVVAIPTTASAYIARVEKLRLTFGARAASFGIFGDPVAPSDVQAFSVDQSELDDLRKCKPNDCGFKLPGSAMQDFTKAVNWKGPAAHAQVDSIVHDYMRRFVTAYRARGNAALVRFDDRGGVEASDAFKALLAQSPVLSDYAPALHAYLLAYPENRPAGATDAIYWSDDRMPHLRPTFSISHVVIYKPAVGLPVIARKQIYASHYFEGAFELTSALDAPGGRSVYLVSVRRYRFDNLPGGILNIRGRVSEALTNALKADLERERTAK